MSNATSRKRPSKAELERRKRQSAGERRNAKRESMRRTRQRQAWKAETAERLGGNLESARWMLANDPDLSDKVYYEWRSLPEKQRGADPVSVVQGGERHTRSGHAATSREAELAAHGFTAVVDLERQAAEDREAERRLTAGLLADREGLAKDAAVMMEANRAMLEWRDTGKGAGGGTLTAHTSWLMFDGYNLGTLWPNDLGLIDSADYAAGLVPAAKKEATKHSLTCDLWTIPV